MEPQLKFNFSLVWHLVCVYEDIMCVVVSCLLITSPLVLLSVLVLLKLWPAVLGVGHQQVIGLILVIITYYCKLH